MSSFKKLFLRRSKRRLESALTITPPALAREAEAAERAASQPTTLSHLAPNSSIPVATCARRDLGIHIVCEPAEPTKAAVDIVFVHGITGDSRATWLDSKSGTFWPETLLGNDILDARIFSFGYDADVSSFWGHVSKNRLREHAQALLGDLVREREETDTQSRNLIFIVHSLGGLVVEKALCLSRARAQPHLKLFEQSTIAIAFLGTPQSGSNLAAWASLCVSLVKKFRDANAEIVNVLKQESEVLSDTQDAFGQLLESRKSENRSINITCFYEELAVPVVGLIVPKSSATLLGYDSYGVPANHMDMARFATSSDIGYKRIVGEVKRWVRQIRMSTNPSLILPAASVSSQDYEECLRALSYDDMFVRRDMIEFAAPETCEWIWRENDLGFQPWLWNGSSIFWISGRPGSGKSTLMKYLSSDISRITQAIKLYSNSSQHSFTSIPIVLTHYFQYNGSGLSRSIQGLLRSIIWQMLFKNPAACQIMLPKLAERRLKGTVTWTRPELELAFLSILRAMHEYHLCIFIDALDEYDGEDVEIASFLDTISRKVPPNIRLCISSRPYPDFAFQFLNCSGLKVHDHTFEDIRSYVRQRFQEVSASDNAIYVPLIEATLQKAEGIFLWVKLACDELQRGWRRYESPAQLHAHLKDMPKDIHSMYRRIIEGMRTEEQLNAWRMLAIVVSAVQPLTAAEFYHAFASSSATLEAGENPVKFDDMSKTFLPPTKPGFLSNDLILELTETRGSIDQWGTTIEGRTNAICRGLVEIQKGYARLLHETVDSFFRNPGISLVQNQEEIAYDDGDEVLLRACLNYQIAVFTSSSLRWEVKSADSPQPGGTFNLGAVYIDGDDYLQYYQKYHWENESNIPFRLSFLSYATRNWLEHAKRAERGTKRTPKTLIDSFSSYAFAFWRRLYQIHNPVPGRALPLDLLNIAIESRQDLYAIAVLRAAMRGDGDPGLLYQENLEHMLFSVAKGGSYEICSLLFEIGLHFPNSPGLSRPAKLRRVPATEYIDTALHRAIYFNHSRIVALMISEGADINVEVESSGLETWLKFGGTTTMTVLGEFDFNPMRKFFTHSTLRRSNATAGSTLRSNLDGKPWTNRALEFAVVHSNTSAFFAILAPYPQNQPHESLSLALTAAVFHGRQEYVQALLDYGADPNSAVQRPYGCFKSGSHTCYALLTAVYRGYVAIAKLLISYGADVNISARCPKGTPPFNNYLSSTEAMTPLSIAQDRTRFYVENASYREILDFLLASGAILLPER